MHEFINRDWKMSFGESYAKKGVLFPSSESLEQQSRKLRELHQEGLATIIHGDFKPQNVFRVTEGIKVCDFPEMRVDRRAVDLIGAIYNIYNAPRGNESEVAAIELIRQYVDGVREEEHVVLNPRELTINTLEARLKYLGVKEFSSDCKFTVLEIKPYVNNWSKFQDVADADLPKKFLEEMFIGRFTAFARYILRGEGAAFLTEFPGFTDLKKQVELVYGIFRKSRVLEESLDPTAERLERLYRAVGDKDS